ncbi:MAG: hypothetical protein IJ654_08955 [Bacteroidales bacterium]|nr:hypothetical protein [Bacteroidales bacterium]
MKRKAKFVTPRVTQSVPVYLETDVLQIQTGSTLYDQEAVSMGIGSENYDLGAGEGGSYIEYSE